MHVGFLYLRMDKCVWTLNEIFKGICHSCCSFSDGNNGDQFFSATFGASNGIGEFPPYGNVSFICVCVYIYIYVLYL